MSDSVDLAVIGAGPAGLSAAAAATDCGLSVALFDEQPSPGGQIWRNLEARGGGPDGLELIARVRASSTTLRLSSTVFDVAFDDGACTLTWMGPTGAGRTSARRIVIATGAMERPVPFPGWTLPGVLGVGALQTALKSGGLVPGTEGGGLVIAGRGPLVLLYLAQVMAAGGKVAAILEPAPETRSLGSAARLFPGALAADPNTVARGALLLVQRTLSRVPIHRGVRRIVAEGNGRVEAVRFTDADGEHTLPCAMLAVHDGVIPNTQVSRMLRLDHDWRDATRCFVPVTAPCGRSSRPGVWVAGDGAGIEGAIAAGVAGRLAALDAARSLERLSDVEFDARAAPLQRRRRAFKVTRRFLDALDPPLDPCADLADATLICRCEEVTAGTIRAALAAGAAGPNGVKTATRCGMGACQGRMCGPVLTQLVARATGRPEAEVGALRIRPPLKPVPLGMLAALKEQS